MNSAEQPAPVGPRPSSFLRISRALLGATIVYCVSVTLVLAILINAPPGTFDLGPTRYEPIHGAMVGHAVGLVVAAFGLFALRKRQACAAWTPRVVLVMVILALVCSFDRILGIIFPPELPNSSVLAMHHARGWYQRPNAFGQLADLPMRTDSRGLRCDDVNGPEPLEGRTRILFLGDSITTGFGQLYKNAFPRRTVDLLNARHARLNAVPLNAGMCGYDSRQEFHFLLHEGFTLDPHLIVLQTCLNDITGQYDPARGADQELHVEFARLAKPTSWSGIGRAIKAITTRIKWGEDLQAVGQRIERYQMSQLLLDPQPPGMEGNWRNCLDQIGLMIDESRKRNIPFAIVCFPIYPQLEDLTATDRPQCRLAEFAGSKNVPFLDLLPAFRGELKARGLRPVQLIFDGTHPTADGHRLAAVVIAGFLESSGVLEEIKLRARN